MSPIRRALISVHDKTGVVEFAAGLAKLGVELVSTGGTAKALREAGLKALDVSELTGFPEMLDGRVKTLHPKVHGGLLFRRDLGEHRAQAAEHGIAPIDLVAVNLYPFEKTVAKPGVTLEEAIEQIDIGGPSMLRSAAKNWAAVTVVCDPQDYLTVLTELHGNDGMTRKETRLRLASKVFALTSRYDAAIGAYLEGVGEDGPPRSFLLQGALVQHMRYGENPHQKAGFYAIPGCAEPNVADARQLSGKEPGFNNVLDLAAALEIVKEFSAPAACVVKHNNPCGAAAADDILEAFKRAYAGDPLSAFGGVIGLNRKLDERLAEEIVANAKVDAIVAPLYTEAAVQILTTKKKWGANAVLLETGLFEDFPGGGREYDVRRVVGGLLVQDLDRVADEFANLKTVTKREPSAEELAALKFAMTICKHVKSNAIVLAQGRAVVGVGAGQMSRVDSVEIAVKKAGSRAGGSVLASDAFFPFPDGLEAAAKAGVKAVIQPGGSVKDGEVIAAADAHGVAMVFTGIRHFRH
ncbi:MAG: bifunctional phosphoribosylaminoimidazolecarboxamide formyltransferase/IMP cyclohydrolase [Planctomycetota bacterium]|nr:bifunctional phosphoribosylaminoimidazolecarboxamide formyltransferase/IMP cyclohydrolase [Planctomycetota bacterium]